METQERPFEDAYMAVQTENVRRNESRFHVFMPMYLKVTHD